MRVCCRDIELPLEATPDPKPAIEKKLQDNLQIRDIGEFKIVRRALDARRNRPRYKYTVEFELDHALANKLIAAKKVEAVQTKKRETWRLSSPPDGPRPVIIGAGPAGLFAALTLAEGGWAPIIIERGKAVKERGRDVSRLYSKGELNPESNVCYGEGGAGTYSDGKLYTRVNDPRFRHLLRALVKNGAPERILIDTRPHIGTDKLIKLLQSLREYLESLGTVFRFETAADSFEVRDGQLRALILRDGERIETHHAIVATGHSAHAMWHALERAGAELEARPFAVGFRIEHHQDQINAVRYGQEANNEYLPAADYKLVHNNEERGVYSFCMCPGGVVVTTPTRPKELCINGMSHAAREGKYANSAMVVTVGPEDFAAMGHTGTFAGAAFQREVEARAYQAGGGQYVAPAVTVSDFMAGQVKGNLGLTSYRRGITPFPIWELYPEVVSTTLREGLGRFDRKMRGFVTAEARLIGVETRTASPVRVLRDPTTRQSTGIEGLYPVGEGMGYGGGIASAAIDGIRSADALLEHVGAVSEEVPV